MVKHLRPCLLSEPQPTRSGPPPRRETPVFAASASPTAPPPTARAPRLSCSPSLSSSLCSKVTLAGLPRPHSHTSACSHAPSQLCFWGSPRPWPQAPLPGRSRPQPRSFAAAWPPPPPRGASAAAGPARRRGRHLPSVGGAHSKPIWEGKTGSDASETTETDVPSWGGRLGGRGGRPGAPTGLEATGVSVYTGLRGTVHTAHLRSRGWRPGGFLADAGISMKPSSPLQAGRSGGL